MKKKQTSAPGEHSDKDKGETDSLSRNIFLFGRLENEVTLPAVKRLLKLDKASTEPINLYINSSGGNGYNADAVIAAIQSIRSTVNTICLGHALSGACEILAS